MKLCNFIFLSILIFSNSVYSNSSIHEEITLNIEPIKTQSLELIDKGALNVPAKFQKMDMWCWATVTAMIGQYFRGNFVEDFQILSHYFQKDCYSFPQSCNRPGQLTEIQSMLSHFFGVRSHIDRVGSFQEIVANIDKGLPIILQMLQPNASVGHVIVLSGYNHNNMVQIIDPMVGTPEWIPYPALFNYKGSGMQWIKTIAVYP